MKTNHELEEAFRELDRDIRKREEEAGFEVEVPLRIKLLVGLQPVYSKSHRRIEIKSAGRLYWRMSKHELEGYYQGYNFPEKGAMILQFVSILGYGFSLTADQIEDFKVEF